MNPSWKPKRTQTATTWWPFGFVLVQLGLRQTQALIIIYTMHFLVNRVENQNEPKRPQSGGRLGSFWFSTRIKRKPLIFFFSARFQWNFSSTSAVSRFFGVQKLKPKVLSLKPRVSTEEEAEGLFLSRIPMVSMKCTFSFRFLIPQKSWNRRFTVKFYWIPWQKKLKNFWGFNWNLNLVTFGTKSRFETKISKSKRFNETFFF